MAPWIPRKGGTTNGALLNFHRCGATCHASNSQVAYLLSIGLNQYSFVDRKVRVPRSSVPISPRPAISYSPATKKTHSRLSDINLLLVAIIWGVNIAIMKVAITEIDLFTFNAIRLSLSAITLAVCVSLEQRNRPRLSLHTRLADSPSPTPSVLKTWLIIASFAILTGGFYQILFAVGMDRTTAGNTALIISSIPMWIAVLSFFILREKLGLAWLGLIVTFIGTIVVTLQKGNISVASENLVGNALILISALAWSTGAIISRPLFKFISPIQLAFYATVGTLPIHYLMSFLMDFPDFDRILEPEIMFCIFYSGIFSTGLAYAMWNYGVQQLGASHAAVYQNLVPLIALLAAWLSPLREIITPIQLIGGFLIIFGLFLTRRLRIKVA